MSVSIPELVKLNDAFWLNCSHEQPTWTQSSHLDSSSGSANFGNEQSSSNSKQLEEIYAIKWYKDDEEFYRFLPNAQPKVSIYETNGIQLDVSYK